MNRAKAKRRSSREGNNPKSSALEEVTEKVNSPRVVTTTDHIELETPSALMKEMQEEYDRKIRVLSTCLEEKAEENTTLYDTVMKHERRIAQQQEELDSFNDLQLVVSDLNARLHDKNDELRSLKEAAERHAQEQQELTQLNEEFQRRISVLSQCLEEMAQENLGYWNSGPTDTPQGSAPLTAPKSSSDDAPVGESSEVEEPTAAKNTGGAGSVEAKLMELTLKQDLEKSERVTRELRDELEQHKKDLTEAEDQLQKMEKRVSQLNNKLMDALNKKASFEESNELYEQKLKSLEQELMENLHQEGIRRQEAEYVASKLKKKVAELQFLLDERDQDSDDSYYSDDDD